MQTITRIAARSAAALASLGLVAGAGLASPWAAPAPGATWLNGDQTPLASIQVTGAVPVGVAFDSAGRMYVSGYTPGNQSGRNVISVYPASWTTSTEPIKVLEGDLTRLSRPASIAFDSVGRMYVTNVGLPGVPGSASVTVYNARWTSGNTAPIKVLQGDATGLMQPFDIAFDSSDRMYVADLGTPEANVGRVMAYAANWASGDTAPTKTLEGKKSKLNYPSGIAFDGAGAMYVVNSGLNGGAQSVAQFRANWSASDAPSRVLAGASTGLNFPIDIAFDTAGRMYITNGYASGTSSSITGYASTWKTGNTKPISTLAGPKSLLTGPFDLAFDRAGRLAVTNPEFGPAGLAVLLYSPPVTVKITGKRTSPTLMTLNGQTTGIAKGTSVVAYIRPIGGTEAFQAQKPVKITRGDLTAGTFTYRITGLQARVAYQVYVVADGKQSTTITIRG